MATRAYDGLITSESAEDLARIRHALGQVGPDFASTFYDASTSQLTQAWSEEIGRRPGFSPRQRAIVAANPATTFGSKSVTAATGGEGPYAFLTRPMEFGADREKFVGYVRKSKNGGLHSVVRRTRRQLPPISSTGWIAYPALGRWSGRVFGMALQILVKTYYDAFGKGSRG